ncbi:MAG TPA: Ig-like domain-containing protein [Gemmatimonadales bacterium]|nr:Ig-like domain-containing protein [Gemmatimonadales bacterium]
MPNWDAVATVTFDALAAPHKRLTIYRAMSSAPGSGPITVTFSKAQSNCQWIVSQWDGVATGGVNGAGAIGQVGSNAGDAVNGLAVVLGAFANSGNVAYGAFGVNRNALAISTGSGFAEITEVPSGENTAADLQAQWATNLNVIAANWSVLNGGALGVEIEAGGPPASVASVDVTPSQASVPQGGTVQLTATPRDADGNPLPGRAVTWKSSDDAVATVDAAGLVTGIALGSATLTAASEGQSGTAIVTVIVPVAKVEIAPAEASVDVGATVQLSGTPQDADGNPLTDRAVAWSSSASLVATVNATGLVTGVSEGATTISATSEGKSGTATITVLPLPGAPVDSIVITPPEASTAIGETVQFTATPLDSAGNALVGRTVTWASSDPGVASVTSAGLAAGVGVGSATITATSEAKSASAAIVVAAVPVATVDVEPASVAIQVGATAQLTVTPRDALGNPLSGRVVSWTTSDANIALVDGSGLVTGAREGAATVSATSEGRSGSSAIAVTAQPSCLERTGPLLTLSGVQTTVFDNRHLGEDTRIDAAAAQFLTGASKAIRVGGGSRSCLRGGEVIGQLPPSTDWVTMHGTYAIQVEGIPFFTLEGMHDFDYGDGITLSDSSRNWLIKGVYFKYMRDDCVQNDWLNSGTIDSSLFDGCSTGLSSRPYATTVDGSANLIVVKNSLFRLQYMDQGYEAPGHGGFFKWAETGPMVSLYNNVYRADNPSSLGGHTLGPPAGKLKDCANNVMIWLGSGPFPEPLPACYTLLTGAAGLAYWDNAVASWKANHSSALADIGPPIVSIVTPLEGASLEAIVTLTATAVDDRDVAGVQFRIDGGDIGSEVTAESPLTKFTMSWDSRAAANGTHVLAAVARDAAGKTTTSAGITLTIANGAASLSTVTASPDTLPAGDSVSTITVTVLDATGAPMPGVPVTLSATGSGNSIVQPGPSGVDGATTGTLRSTVAGDKTVTAVAGGVALSQHPVVTVVAAAPDPVHSSVSASPTSIAVGSSGSTITVTVRDQFDNPVGGATVELAATGTGNIITQPGPTNALGVTSGTLSSSEPETKTVSAKANTITLDQTASVTVTAQGPPATITHTLLTSGHDVVNQRTYITGSISPAPNTLVTVAVLTHQSSAAAPSPTLSGGGMASWDVVATVAYNGATPLDRLTIYRAVSAAPGSGPITIMSSITVSNCQWIVSQWTGVDLSGTNGSSAIAQTASASGTAVATLTAALGDFAGATSVAYGAFGVANATAVIAPGSGFATIDQQPSGESTVGDLFAEWAVLLPGVTATWPSRNAGALGVEIRASVGP